MRTRLLTFLVVLAAVLLTGAAVASAHGDEGEVSLTKLEQTGPTTVAIEVGIVYSNDEEVAVDAQVSATLTGPEGATVGPVALSRTAEATSLYTATVEVPSAGDWSVAVTSSTPTGEVEGGVTVASTASTTAPTSTDTPATDSATTDAAIEPLTSGSKGSNAAVIVAACLVLAALTIGGAFVIASRRTARDRSDTSGSGDSSS